MTDPELLLSIESSEIKLPSLHSVLILLLIKSPKASILKIAVCTFPFDYICFNWFFVCFFCFVLFVYQSFMQAGKTNTELSGA